MWDEKSMSYELDTAGFTKIRRCSFGDSTDPMFSLVESRDRFFDNGIVEVAFECKRPLLERSPA
jgi:hypothetical protein